MNNRFATIALIAPVGIAGIGFVWWAAPPPAAVPPGPAETITVGRMSIPVHALLYIAEDRGFFAENGLDVAVLEYGTGPAGIGAGLPPR